MMKSPDKKFLAVSGIAFLLAAVGAGHFYMENQQLEEDYTSMAQTASTLNTSLAEKRSQVTNLSTRISTLQEEKEQIEQDRTQLQNEYDQYRSKARVFASFDSWAKVQGTLDTYRFTTVIFNAGGSEAKNIELICGVEDDSGVWFVETKEVGNLASDSSETVELEFTITESTDRDDWASCRIRNCEDDCINLERNVDILRQSIEDMERYIESSGSGV